MRNTALGFRNKQQYLPENVFPFFPGTECLNEWLLLLLFLFLPLSNMFVVEGKNNIHANKKRGAEQKKYCLRKHLLI